ncbi:hypothetical protein [Niabella hibiscisoli]|uniref:hypothetical protein n=1 Tax=Niabella hibiscisoli TaxID=1825928 RepID=UPI001F0D46F4|nr:hypothetical protein [Niabella hibiscisoli]MCH5718765.1 hypothetical protein [Niabella hibiscisoli]
MGCGLEDRKKELDERELRIADRERMVILREKELQLFEDSLKRNIAIRDSSLLLTDSSSLPLPDSLSGSWDVTMLCTKTNCTGFAVGDTRKETWLFIKRDEVVSVRAMQGDKLIRVYVGAFNGEGFQLSVPPTATDSLSSSMTVSLKVEGLNKLSGERLIRQADGCNSFFKVDITRPAVSKNNL